MRFPRALIAMFVVHLAGLVLRTLAELTSFDWYVTYEMASVGSYAAASEAAPSRRLSSSGVVERDSARFWVILP